MKVCNYCGTGMDNSVMKCPFCRMEMDMRGAVKYQDNTPFDPNMPARKARDGKTPAELRYEAMLAGSDEERGLSLSNLFNRREAEHMTDAKSLLDAERAKQGRAEKRILWEISEEDDFDLDVDLERTKNASGKTIPKIELGLPKNTTTTKTEIPPLGNFIKVTVFVIVFILIITFGMFNELSYDDYATYEEYYSSAENFVPGTVEEGVYFNKYAGITFNTDGICDYINIYEDDEYLWFSEFYAQEGSDHMYITYVNEDYSGYMSAEEMVDEVEEYTDGTVVSNDMHYICGYDFVGITTYHEYEDEDDGQMYGTYDAYMACQVTDDYYAVIEIVADDYDDIAIWIEGFEDV